MTSVDSLSRSPWLDLSDAAQYIGVHFTTLRRWADAGQVPCIRTPGGRRRFARAELDRFLESMRQSRATESAAVQVVPLEARTLDVARRQLRSTGVDGQASWGQRFGEEQRLKFRYSGQRLLGLLVQFSSRTDAAETFLDEGKRLAADYGSTCRQAGMSITETVKTFLFFGHSMLEAVQQAGSLGGENDAEGLRLYQRMSDFLDTILLATIESYSRTPAPGSSHALEG